MAKSCRLLRGSKGRVEIRGIPCLTVWAIACRAFGPLGVGDGGCYCGDACTDVSPRWGLRFIWGFATQGDAVGCRRLPRWGQATRRLKWPARIVRPGWDEEMARCRFV